MNAQEYHGKIKQILIPHMEIVKRIAQVAGEISAEYEGKPLLLVTVLKGAFVFLADFCRALTIPCEIGFMRVKSYFDGTISSGEVTVLLDLEQDISQYHVILVEDIVDTGRTLSMLTKLLQQRNPLSLKVVALLDKPSRRVVDCRADYALFTIEDRFVIGYGMDCGELYRNLPDIAEYDTEHTP
ncbi:MAG: hypoxanthine phosphoribosyltransferase [Oscillospiraceae bacterium]|nr:hypoxanthine phosphoribosyltransferase [Oscillospiraceae bacterium]